MIDNMSSGQYNCLTEQLRPRPRHKDIHDYDAADPALMASVRKNGILEQLVLCGLDVLIGCRRLDAAKRLNMSSVPVRDLAHPWKFTMWDETPRLKPEWADDAVLIMAMLDSNVDRQKSTQGRNREIGLRFMIGYCLKQQERLAEADSIDGQLDDLVKTIYNLTIFQLSGHEKIFKVCEKYGHDYAFAYAVKQGWIEQFLQNQRASFLIISELDHAPSPGDAVDATSQISAMGAKTPSGPSGKPDTGFGGTFAPNALYVFVRRNNLKGKT